MVELSNNGLPTEKTSATTTWHYFSLELLLHWFTFVPSRGSAVHFAMEQMSRVSRIKLEEAHTLTTYFAASVAHSTEVLPLASKMLVLL